MNKATLKTSKKMDKKLNSVTVLPESGVTHYVQHHTQDIFTKKRHEIQKLLIYFSLDMGYPHPNKSFTYH